MKFLANLFSLVIAATLCASGALAAEQSSFDLKSPDKRIEVRIRTAHGIHYDVVLEGRAILEDSTLSMDVDHKTLGKDNTKVVRAKATTHDEVVEPVVRQKFAKIRDHYNEQRIEFDGGYAVTFRAYNEGVAYRFETSLPASQIKIYGEEMNLNFAANDIVYYPQEDSFMSHNERKYLPHHLSDVLPEFIATLPAIVQVGQGASVAVAESDVDEYPGLWLKGTGASGLAATFPPFALKDHKDTELNVPVTEAADYIAVTKGTRTYPWRVLGIVDQDKDLLTNSIVYLLESPSKIADTSWIKPGKVAWDWWNALNLYGVDFKAGVNTDTYKYFIDFAAKYQIPYIILDEGWYKHGDILEVVPDVNMEELASYSKQKNVGLILWAGWKELDEKLIPALDQFQKWGVQGIKVDFMQRSDQWMIEYFHRVCREAAQRHILVDFHGDQKPATMTRTWPNLINTEGVRGMEWDKWSAETDPKHSTTLPFTRMFLGPMDYTPGAMLNGSKLEFRAVATRPMSMGTRCQQLALYVIYDAPLQMLSDSPSNYEREPEAMEFLKPVPSVWDDTKPLSGKISDYVVVARRSGNDWYVGAMTDWTARDLDIDFSFLPDGDFHMQSYEDGVNADRMGGDYKMKKSAVNKSTKLKVHLAPGGGWAARLTP
ncbi:MAG TPA: glycoside hydrolase family 97 protein [Candidatus Acidoferrum sp.]|jgi:alpha-glucosidase